MSKDRGKGRVGRGGIKIKRRERGMKDKGESNERERQTVS